MQDCITNYLNIQCLKTKTIFLYFTVLLVRNSDRFKLGDSLFWGPSVVFNWWVGWTVRIPGVLEEIAVRQGLARAVYRRAYISSSTQRPQNRTPYIVVGFSRASIQEIRSYQSLKSKTGTGSCISSNVFCESSSHWNCVVQRPPA